MSDEEIRVIEARIQTIKEELTREKDPEIKEFINRALKERLLQAYEVLAHIRKK